MQICVKKLHFAIEPEKAELTERSEPSKQKNEN